jgi:hypothetical protein
VDNGVVMPIFNLLSHSDIEVQIAATATVCNIVTEFSPMREVCYTGNPHVDFADKLVDNFGRRRFENPLPACTLRQRKSSP